MKERGKERMEYGNKEKCDEKKRKREIKKKEEESKRCGLKINHGE